MKTDFYRGAIPQEIGLTFGLASMGSETSVWSWLIPAPPKSCGGAIFRLDDATARAIRERGVAFFKSATQGRDYTDRAHQFYHYYSYKPWQETPLPDGWISRSVGVWRGLSCMGLGLDYAEGIAQAADGPGSFYTTGASKLLVIIPERHLVVYTYTH